ncbi:MAG: pyridoxal-dependent decarboxylase [Ignavibacteriae bacterium]|nr:pyridoxal-dependent decarboxylase [Ignavibacteriota bacterium]
MPSKTLRTDTETTPLANGSLGDMSPSEFRKHAAEFTEWIIRYLEHPERYKVLADVAPGDIKAKLPGSAPEQPESMESIFSDLDSIIAPALTHWNHPGFMAYFSNTASKPGILGEFVSAAINPNAMLWRTGPAVVELEEVVLDWLRQLLGLSADFYGLIHEGASLASLVALAAARESLNLRIREEGMIGRTDLPKLRVYASEHSHSSIDKAAIILGVGQSGITKIESDAEFRMIPDALERKIEIDLKQGVKPMAVVATVGTTSSTAVDPVKEIAAICRRYNIWLHIDAAYAGSAAVLSEKRWIFEGSETADSIVVNPHKWLFVPVDCSVLYCRKPDILRRAFSLIPEYLKTNEEVRNPMDYGVTLGRRFRALKLWFVIRTFGAEGIRERLRYHIQIAQDFKSWIEESPDFELIAPAPFSVVCFRYNPSGKKLHPAEIDKLNETLMERVNSTGEVFLSHTKLRNCFVLRIAIGNLGTTERHVKRAWELLQEHSGTPRSA